MIDTVLGFLPGVTLSAIIQYFFGSSAGSKSKDAKIQEMSENMRGQTVNANTVNVEENRS